MNLIKLSIISAAALALPTSAQEQPPQGEGRWGVLVTTVIAVESPAALTQPIAPPRVRSVTAGTDAKVLLVTFPSREACEESRNLALNPSGFTMPLGSGSGVFAHVGLSVTPCFRQP